MTRREVLAVPAVALAQTQQPDWMSAVVKRHDEYVDNLLSRQNTDSASRWRGLIPDDFGIHHPGSGAGIVDACIAAWLNPGSKHHKSNTMPQRIGLAADALRRHQTDDGNWHLLTTNFSSPPDTGFIIRAMAPGATLLKRVGNREIFGQLEPILRKAGAGMSKGGVHTPNHRWVICAALAQLHDLFGEPAYLRRIDQWLAEGIDIDPDGQFTERSTYVYNPVTDNAFVTMAAKLKRPQLLEPARKNLDSMLYLLHPGYEVVTEISRRQDLNARGDMGPYWFALAYLAHHDRNGQFATLARHFAPTRAGLSLLMEHPELATGGPAPQPVPDRYTTFYRHNQLVHVRQGPVSAIILGAERNRVFGFRNGDAVINAVRFASAFFGKGQFAPARIEENNGAYRLTQSLEGPYYQPLDPPRAVGPEDWGDVRAARRRSEISTLTQSAAITPTAKGFRVRIQSQGQADVPLSVEINFRAGGKFEGPVEPVPRIADAFSLKSGYAVYRVGSHGIRFGPGANEHLWTQVRGSDPKLPGPSVYLTGFTPFDRTIEIETA